MSWQWFPIVGLSMLAVGSAAAGLHYWLRLRMPKRLARYGQVSLVMPLTGMADGLPSLIRCLEEQTLPARRLLIAVESMDDPAAAATLEAAASSSLPIQLVVAGHALHSAQKARNLEAALTQITPDDDAVVLLDADILPPDWWLAALATPVLAQQYDLVSGYRWPTAVRATLGTHLIISIDRSLAVLPRPPHWALCWGGSIALRPAAWDALPYRERLAATLSDDLTLATLAHERRLRCLVRRALLVPSPLDLSLTSAWKFGRRQYQMIRLYRPSLWVLAVLLLLIQTAGWGILLSHLSESPAVQLAGASLLGLAALRLTILNRIGRHLGVMDTASSRMILWALCAAKPLVDLFHFSMVLAAGWTRSVSWGHVRYRVRSPTDISVIARRPWFTSAP